MQSKAWRTSGGITSTAFVNSYKKVVKEKEDDAKRKLEAKKNRNLERIAELQKLREHFPSVQNKEIEAMTKKDMRAHLLVTYATGTVVSYKGGRPALMKLLKEKKFAVEAAMSMAQRRAAGIVRNRPNP